MILKIDGKFATLMTRATPKLLAILGGLEGRRTWAKDGKSLRVEATAHNVRIILAMGDVDIEKENDVIPEMEQFVGRTPYKEKTVSMPHQVRCREKMAGKKVFALFLEMGAGKSKIALDYAGELYCAGKITGVLITSKRGPHSQFIISQAPLHLNCEWSGIVWPFTEDQFPKKGLQIVSFNIDAIRTKRGMNVATAFCEQHKGRLLIICDESQDIKSAGSERHKAMLELKEYSSHRLVATGTPISVSLLDEKSQIDWLDNDIIGVRYKTTFLREYCITGGFAGKQIIGYRNIDKFREKVDPYVFRVTQEEFGVMPPIEEEWVIDLLPIQKKAIKQIKDDLEVTINNDTLDVATAIVAMTKIQQITSGFIKIENNKIHRFINVKENPRITAAVEWVQSGEKSKAIIWAVFQQDNKMLAERFIIEGISFSQLYGQTSSADREEAIRGFMDPEGPQVLIASQAVVGSGFNLQGLCNRALFYSNSYKYIDRVQAEARINRIGTIGIITNTDIIARGGIDRNIISNLKKKQGISQLALGDLISIIEEA